MPQLFRVGSYVVYFWINESNPLEPVHVHIAQVRPVPDATKVWITRSGKCLMQNNNSQIPERELRFLIKIIEVRSAAIIEKWKETFQSVSSAKAYHPVKRSVPMNPYIKKVQYYETDMMGIAHHANYIRWMEEARIDFLDQMGFPYARMEAEGIISPVRAVSCQYKKPCTFGDTLNISVAVDGFNGVVLTLRYDMTNEKSGELVCQARSEHVFMRRGGGLLRMKRDMPEFTAALEGMCPQP